MHEPDYNCACGGAAIELFAAHLPRARFLAAPEAFAAGTRGGKTASAAPMPSGSTAARPVTVFTARRVITMEPGTSDATAVAVDGDTILGVGTLDRVQGQMRSGGRSFTIDRTFEEKVIAPGFVEHHLHPLLGVASMSVEIIAIEDWALPGSFAPAALDEVQYKARLRSALDAMSAADANETLFTWGYHHYFHGIIYRSHLDAIESTRPIVTWHRSCHEFILNTAALKKYGVTEAALVGHGLASEQSSWEDGHFYEKGMEIIIPFIAKDLLAPKRTQAGLSKFKSYLLAKGVTTICEPGTQMDRKVQTIWESVLNTDDAVFRTYFVPDGRALYDKNKSKNTLGGLVDETKSYTSWGSGKVQWLPNQVKLFADGAIFSQLMQVEQPYLDGHTGQWIAEPPDYAAAFKTYWDAGYRIHTHVNGDKGLQVVVDALADRTRANPRSNHRFTVVHFAVSTEEQVTELGKMGAYITANPYYVTSLADKYSESGLGPERANSMVRLASVEKAGMPISLHSDMPMAPADPLFLAWCAVNRTTVSGRVAGPEQRIAVDRALRAITIDSALMLSKEDELGSIKPGKKADFTILEQDPYAVAPSALKDVKVWGVVFEGRKYPASSEAASRSKAGTDLEPDALDFAKSAKLRG